VADLTYFIGRPFVALEEGENGEWSILLDGEARVTNKDPGRPLPEEDVFKGSQFLRPIYSELDTRLQFGVMDNVVDEIVLTPTMYTMTDPSLTTEEEFYPQVPIELTDTLPPDPSDERVADGPETTEEKEADENAA